MKEENSRNIETSNMRNTSLNLRATNLESPTPEKIQFAETYASGRKSKFMQLIESKEKERESSTTQMAYVKQLSVSALKMKQTLQKEFNETVKDININEKQIALMSEKAMDRIKHLQEERLKRKSTIQKSERSLGHFSRQYSNHHYQLEESESDK